MYDVAVVNLSKNDKMCSFKLYFLIFTICFHISRAQISDKRLCMDPECSVPISEGKTLMRFSAPDRYRLSFGSNELVTIYSKSAGSDMSLWGAEINGKRGYIPKAYIKETKKHGEPHLLVDTELVSGSNSFKVSENVIPNPSKVLENYEVIDGTTIYKRPDDVKEEKSNEYVQKEEKMESNQKEKVEIERVMPGDDSVVKEKEILPHLSYISSENEKNDVTISKPKNEHFNEQMNEKTQVLKDPANENIQQPKDEIQSVKHQEKVEENLDGVAIEIEDESQMKPDEIIWKNDFKEISKPPEKNEEQPVSQKKQLQVKESTDEKVQNLTQDVNDENSNTNQNQQETPEIQIDKPINATKEEAIIEEKNQSNSIYENVEKIQNEQEQKMDMNNSNESSELEKDEPIKLVQLKDEKSSLFQKEKEETKPTFSEDSKIDVTQSSVENRDFNKEESVKNTQDRNENYPDYLTEGNNNTLEEVNNSSPVEAVTRSSLYKNPDFATPPFPSLINTNFIPNAPSDNIQKEIETEEKSTESDEIGEYSQLNTSEYANEEVTKNINEPLNKNTDFYGNSIPAEYSSPGVQEVESPPIKDEEVIQNVEKHAEEVASEKTNSAEDFNNNEDGNVSEESPIFFSYFSAGNVENKKDEEQDQFVAQESQEYNENESFCTKTSYEWLQMVPDVSSDFFLYLVTTAISVIIFLLGYFLLDKNRREGPLVAKINKLEHEYLILLKEKEILTEKFENGITQSNDVSSNREYINIQQAYDNMIKEKQALEEQVQTLEKELENSTEVGLELNKMLSELLSSENAGATLMSNIEELQSQLAEQQDIVKSMKETISLKETENHELNLEFDISSKKVVELQTELDKLLLNVIKIEEEKETLEKNSQNIIAKLKEEVYSLTNEIEKSQEENEKKLNELADELTTSQHNLQLKIKEYEGLKSTMHELKVSKNSNTLESLLEVNSIKAELEQLKVECQTHCENLSREKDSKRALEKRVKTNQNELDVLKEKYDQVDKARLELETKLEVLTNYFKDKETQLQKELSKYESMWSAKQGEATSTSEKIKYLQSEVQNYKSQNELLKQEIVSQEVELKSQISVLEKKVHENWVSARQAERRLEDLKQEAAQLRNRLTLRERALQDNKARVQSPLEHNGEMPLSPLHIESPSSPPMLYSSRDHMTKSPAMLGMPPPPFLPPPPGAPFLPPHLPFMPPPPPDMFPGDHRPPPLGRMSSPPLNSRYSPDRRSYSTYDRRSPSPSYDDSEYGTSPVHRRYSPFPRRDHRRKFNGRSGEISSGSGNSNESLDELNSKV